MPRLTSALALFLIAGAAVGASTATATADSLLTLSITENNGNLVTSAYGSVDLAGLNLFSSSATSGIGILYNQGFRAGPSVPNFGYTGVTGPTSFGSPSGGGGVGFSSGDYVQLEAWAGRLYLPQSYVSNAPLYGTSTVFNATYGSLNLTPGTYMWTYGSGEHAGRIVLNIPTPGATAVLGLAGLVATRRRR